MTVDFVKMHGAGNDFVMIDDRTDFFPLDRTDLIARIANRPDGVGCEGVIFVCRSSAPAFDFAMRFFNPDGSEAELCGNGARCVAAFAYSIGAAKARTMRFETLAGPVAAEVLSDDRVRLMMPRPKDLRENFVNSGVPHLIVPVKDLSAAEVVREGRRLRYSPQFAPVGTNVDFVEWTGSSSLSIRTYERGVEDETFACGTGSVAAALVGVAQYGLEFPVEVRTFRGDVLVIDGVGKDGGFAEVTLTGPVKTVFAASLQLDFKL